MPQSIQRAPARTKEPRKGWQADERASTVIITIAGIGTITIGGLLAWFFLGSVMMTMPGIVGFMGFVAVVLAIGLTIRSVAGKGG